MSFEFRLMPWAQMRPLLAHFQRFVWLHPHLADVGPALILHAIHEGHLVVCETRPWLAASPALTAALRNWIPSEKQWAKIRRGPSAHEALIHRCARNVLRWPGAKVVVDESVREASLPPGWGGIARYVPDIEVRFDDPLEPSYWIECERSFKSARYYAAKIASIRHSYLFYVVPGEFARQRLQGLVPYEIQHERRGFRILTEVQWMAFSARVSRKLRRRECWLRLGEALGACMDNRHTLG